MIEKRRTKSGEVRYDVRLRRPDGREYSRTFRTKKEAESFQATERADRARGNWIDPTAGQVRFEVWADEWLSIMEPSWRPRTFDRHSMALRVHWKPRFVGRSLNEISPRLVQAAITDLAGSHSAATVGTYYRTLRALFRGAMDLELIGRTPCRSIKLPSDRSEERRVIEPSQLHQLADAVGPNWRAMIYVGGVMGLRFGEAAALQVQDVDLVEHRLYVSKTVVEANGRISIDVPKTSAGLRTLALPDPLVDELRDHIERSGLEDPEALLFGSSTGVPVRRSNFARRVFGPAVESCGLDGLTFHGLRHSAATQWVAAGLDARTVQHRLGHADPRLVLRLYAHVSSRADQEAARTTAETFWSKVDAGSARDGAESVERNP